MFLYKTISIYFKITCNSTYYQQKDVTYPVYPVKEMLGFPITTPLRQQLKVITK